ncbi:hypothetical protein [Ramlibacter albus]|uniref:Uncharacterized protein n=1 Tax=Ramlibacter albus TaxID=2079448 RepID=A0A923MC15_9BURK|nr:hypothetical protein [Ramlibacter albus]MBC5766559.1 hypothetical protein [Ramlibacter albus]
MDLLADQPPGFHEVRNAYTVARELPLWRDAPVKVGVCRGDGELVATGIFGDHRQARLFTIQMTALGYAECEAALGCDRVYVPERWEARGMAVEQALEAA